MCDVWEQPKDYDVLVTRYVGETEGCVGPCSPDYGPLKYPDILVAEGKLGRFAELSIAAYDVDMVGSQCFSREFDEVIVNGIPVRNLTYTSGTLTGANRRWSITRFLIPIEVINFPARKGINEPPDPASAPPKAKNRITIGTNHPCRCVAIGWISLEIQASSPVVLLHGLGGSAGFWTKPVITFTNALDDGRIVYEAIDHNDASVKISANQVHLALPRVSVSLGVDSMHLVAHSKGGLDGLYYLAYHHDPRAVFPAPPGPGEFSVVSFTSLDSPLRGSALADIAFRWFFILGFGTDGFEEPLIPILGGIIGPFGGNLYDLTVAGAESIVNSAVRRLDESTAYHTVSSDLDQNDSKHVSCPPSGNVDEALTIRQFVGSPVLPVEDCSAARVLLDKGYRTLRTTYSARVDLLSNPPKVRKISVSSRGLGEQGNDILVTIRSAWGTKSYKKLVDETGGRFTYNAPTYKTHASVADDEVAWDVVIPWLLAAEQEFPGDMRPLRVDGVSCPDLLP